MQPAVRTSSIFLAVLVASLGCDHATKQIATASLADGGVSLLGDTLQLQLARNPGAFLNLGAGLPEGLRAVLFLGLVPVLIAFVCLALRPEAVRSRRALVGLALLAGGGLGNWIDRLGNGGAVTDFVVLGFGALRTGIFNGADVAVVAGVALIALSRWRGSGPSARAESAQRGADAR